MFIKHSYQFMRLLLADILLLEADNTYTTERKYSLRLPLSQVLERLHCEALVRVHRSYALNRQHVAAFSDQEATVARHVAPLGWQYKEAFLRATRAQR